MLKISNVSFAYQNQDVLSQVNLTLPSRGRVAIIGDNGSGKSTLLQLIAGRLRPDDGSIKLDGAIGFLPQVNYATDQSGGEATRQALEQLFALDYDVLLLDEPTNNLDHTNLNWLVVQLQRYTGLALIVSHDRTFIDQVADHVVELKDQKLYDYPGNYSDYRTRQEQQQSQAQAAYQKAQRTKSALQKQIQNAYTSIKIKDRPFDKIKDENRMTFKLRRSNAQAALGKVIRTANTQLTKLDAIAKPTKRKVYQANLDTALAKHKRLRLILLENLTKSYGDKVLFDNLNLTLYTGERCQVVGDNGTGKTTLFRIIMGKLQPDHGIVKIADNSKIGYIAQDVYGLDLAQNFLSQVEANPTEIFQAATTMDLSQQDLKRKLNQVSRGQLTKLAFLKIMLAPVDLLILDEPTNHLDIRTRENIEQALINYTGAILFATHDQAFAQALNGRSREVKQIILSQ